MKPRPLTLILLLAALAAPAAAQFTPQATASPGSAPQGINYQGRLEDNGFPATGSKQMVFRVFDVASGGTALWTSPAQAVDVQIGLFNAVVPVPLTALVGGGSRYLEVQIDGTVMAPRELLNSVPYALIAKSVEGTIDVSTAGLSVVANSAATTPSLHISSQSGTVGVGTAAVSGLFVVGAGTLVVNADGYVGLGLSSPQARLGIRDSNAATTVGSKAFLELYNSDFTAGNTYGIHFRQFDAVGSFQTVGVIDAVGVSHAAGAQSGALAFGTRNAGAFSEKMRIDAGGSVGIGTPSPSAAAKLDVVFPAPQAAAERVLRLATSENSDAGFIKMERTAGTVVSWDWRLPSGIFSPHLLLERDGLSRVTFGAQGGMGVGTMGSALSNGTLVVRSTSTTASNPVLNLQNDGGTELLRVQQDGNIGIGTTNPATKLDVAGHQLFSVAGASITFNAGGPTIGVPTGNTLAFGTSGIERARINNVGNIGIGTSNPTLGTLQVSGAGTANIVLEHTGGADIELHSNDGNGLPGIRTSPTTTALSLQESGNTVLGRVSGRVGVGTPNPVTKIHMSSGTITVDGNAADSLTTTGNVGVGTASPGSRLHVFGGTSSLGGAIAMQGAGISGLFLFVGDNSGTDTGNNHCSTAASGGLCLASFTSGGAASTCATALANGRHLCVAPR